MLKTITILLLTAVCANAKADTLVCFEAESSTNVVSLMQVGSSTKVTTNKAWSAVTGASGDRYIELPQSTVTNSTTEAEAKKEPPIPGKVRFDFNVSNSGVYKLWCRVWWLDTCGNSLSISIDGARTFSFGQDRTFKSWHWVKAHRRLKQLNLSKGKHSMLVSAREDGIRIDQILFTDDKDYVPVGIEDVTNP
jgi:hypothetical protein